MKNLTQKYCAHKYRSHSQKSYFTVICTISFLYLMIQLKDLVNDYIKRQFWKTGKTTIIIVIVQAPPQ